MCEPHRYGFLDFVQYFTLDLFAIKILID